MTYMLFYEILDRIIQDRLPISAGGWSKDPAIGGVPHPGVSTKRTTSTTQTSTYGGGGGPERGRLGVCILREVKVFGVRF